MAIIKGHNGTPLVGVPTTRAQEFSFGDTKSDILVAGPNEDFLRKIDLMLGSLGIHPHYIRYNRQLDGRKYKKIFVFAVEGLEPDKQHLFQQWCYYLGQQLSTGNIEDMVVIN